MAGDGRAGPEVTGERKVGRVKLTISEYAGDEGPGGKMDCPGAPAVDNGLATPPSQTVASFAILQVGARATELDAPDDTGQFGYHASWTLVYPRDVFGP